jgi:glycosyl hydrolase family 10
MKPLLSLTCLLVITATSAFAAEQGRNEEVKKYRVIFNCDGHAVCKDAEGDLDQWIKNLFAPLEKSHVEALFWCDGAGGNTANYDSRVLEMTGERIGKLRPWIAKLLKEGHDPPKVVVQEAKKRGLDVFYSFRINDIHDSFMPDELATFKVKHPEWQIGEKKYGDVTSFPTALNFAVPEVRELKCRVIEELFQKYDFDGLEIDFLRCTPYFHPGTEGENAHLLTELLERIRKHLNQRGRQRGRPIRLAVRIDENLKACRLDGFEVRTWLDKELIDYLVLGSGVIDIEVEEFKKLAAPHGVFVYPCLYGWPSKYQPIPPALAAGLGLNYWHQGADGIYLFNWFPHEHNNSESTGPYMAGLLKQIGDPRALQSRKQLMFAAERGRPQRAYQYNWLNSVLPAPLPSGDLLRVSIMVGGDFRGAGDRTSFKLQLAITNLLADDVIEATLNGKPLSGLKSTGKGSATAMFKAAQLKQGRNAITLKLAGSSTEATKPRTVTALEIHVSKAETRQQQSVLLEQHKLEKRAAVQGLALTKNNYFSSTSRKIYRFDTKWKLLQEKTIQIEGVNHVGAIHHHDGYIWAGLLNGPVGDKYDKKNDRSMIAKLRADDLEIVKTWDITSDVTWIDPVCFDGKFLWVGDLSDLGIHRYRFVEDKIVRDGIFRYPKEMHFSQGIRVVGDKLYTIHTFGSMDGLYEFEIPKQLTAAVNQPMRVWTIQETRMHLEGFDFIPGKPNQIWHCQGGWVDRYELQGLTSQ